MNNLLSFDKIYKQNTKSSAKRTAAGFTARFVFYSQIFVKEMPKER